MWYAEYRAFIANCINKCDCEYVRIVTRVYQEAIHQNGEIDDRRNYAWYVKGWHGRSDMTSKDAGIWRMDKKNAEAEKKRDDDPRGSGEAERLLLRSGTPQDHFPSMA